MESKVFRISRIKTEYMRYNFGTTIQEEKDISLEGQECLGMIPFDISDQCYRKTRILMKILAIELK